MKKAIVIFFVCVLIIVGTFFFIILDRNKSLALPVSQRTNTAWKMVKKHNNKTPLNHVVIILMENKSYNDIVGSPNAPFINALIKKYSFGDNYFAVSHPSLPNYIALIGGSTFGITNDCTDCYVNATNLIDQLEQVRKSWKAYMESMPSPCFIGSSGKYAQKHNPFIYFNDIRTNKNRCQNIVPYTQLSTDFKTIQTTPNFSWISPNLCHDMHDCSVNTGDTWLAKNLPTILNSPAFTKQKSLLVITWDEGEGSGGNKIPTVFIGDLVKNGYVSHKRYTHYSLLHTIEHIWNIPPLTMNASQSAVISDIFKNK